MKRENRINEQIRVPRVRLFQDGNQLGVFNTKDAQAMARQNGLDLVEIAPEAQPPVCHILDYGKWRYEREKKAKEAKKNQKEVDIKELWFRPATGDHDIETKVNHAIQFLESGKKVQIAIRYKNREMAHKEVGFKVMQSIVDQLLSFGTIIRGPIFQGKQLICLVDPKSKTQ